MAILSDNQLHEIYDTVFPLEEDRDRSLINPASIDIRIGGTALLEACNLLYNKVDFEKDIIVGPGEFLLVSTYEYICIPTGFLADLKLKSSIARLGWNHSLSFLVDPGWSGVLTLELSNITRYQNLKLTKGMRFAQLVIHELTSVPERPYSGRYQNAKTVEASKLNI